MFVLRLLAGRHLGEEKVIVSSHCSVCAIDRDREERSLWCDRVMLWRQCRWFAAGLKLPFGDRLFLSRDATDRIIRVMILLCLDSQ
jgi:hypothetical protein